MTSDQAVSLRMMTKGKSKNGSVLSENIYSESRDEVRVIAVTSGKGGVGKTSIAANLSFLLAKRGKETLLVDADAGLANVDVMLGITPEHNLYHVLKGEKTVSDVIVKGPGGVNILPASSGIQEMAELSRGEKLSFVEDIGALDRKLDYIVIDTAAGISSNVMYFNMIAKEILVVTTPEPAALTDAYALIKLSYKRYGAKRYMLVVNMARSRDEAESVYRRLTKATDHFLNISINYLGYMLFEQGMEEAVRRQCLFSEIFPASAAANCLKKIAGRLLEEEPEAYDSGTIKLFGRAMASRECHA